MAVKKPAKPMIDIADLEKFVSVAPDGKLIEAKSAPKLVMKGDKAQITVTFDLPTLEALNATSGELGVSRAGLINMAVKYFLKKRVGEIS